MGREDMIKDVPIFAELSNRDLGRVAKIMVPRSAAAGEVIIKENDQAAGFFIITSGSVEVFKTNKVIGLLQKGDCFGEMGYLAKTERSATIIAQNYVQLMKINSTLIDQISVECQLHFSRVFLKTLVKRLSDTTAMYASLSDNI